MQRLVIFAPNWVGDSVMAQPAIADLRRELAATSLIVLARPSVAPVFSMMPEVDEILPLEKRSVVGVDGDVRKALNSVNAALLFPNSLHAAVLAYRAGIPERWGYRTDCRSPLLTRAVERRSGIHQVRSFQQLVSALGFPSQEAVPALAVSAALREEGLTELRGSGWNGRDPLVALAPGAAYGSAKRWPAVSFAALASDLGADGIATILVGGPADRDVGATIVRSLGPSARVHDLIGQNDVRGMAGVLTHCRALVANDSGAMHLGAAIGVPVTVPFGPTDERLSRPIGPKHAVLTHDVWCRPCMLRECPLDHRCMRGIGVAAVATAARRWL
jgi:heptosyltransferase-2